MWGGPLPRQIRLLLWRPHHLTSCLSLSIRSSPPLLRSQRADKHSGGSCTHKGGSSGRTRRAAHRRGTEVTSWQPRVRNTEPRWGDWRSLPLFPLHSDDIGSYVRMSTRPLTARASIARTPTPLPTQTLNSSFSAGWDSPVHCNASTTGDFKSEIIDYI